MGIKNPLYAHIKESFFSWKKCFWVQCLLIMFFYTSCSVQKKSIEASSHTKEVSSSKKIKNKYAVLLGVTENQIANIKLYSFIDNWYAIPYQYAGKSKKGVDCSGLASLLYQQVYNKQVSGPAASIYKLCIPLPRKELQEGDLVFFKIESNDITHIGIYLQNNKFVHASTKRGVIISDLDEAYYKKYYYKGGRVK